MKNCYRNALLALLGGLFCIGVGFLLGQRVHDDTALISEYKVTAASFMQLREGGDPALREYMKAKYYFYANRIPDDYFPSEGDFGPVNNQALTNVILGKGPTTADDEYQRFKEREARLKAKR